MCAMVSNKCIDVFFSIGRYDQDGDMMDGGIFLHFDNTSIKVAESLSGLYEFMDSIEKIIIEIRDNYQGAVKP